MIKSVKNIQGISEVARSKRNKNTKAQSYVTTKKRTKKKQNKETGAQVQLCKLLAVNRKRVTNTAFI